jgi:hypothetical protein
MMRDLACQQKKERTFDFFIDAAHQTSLKQNIMEKKRKYRFTGSRNRLMKNVASVAEAKQNEANYNAASGKRSRFSTTG